LEETLRRNKSNNDKLRTELSKKLKIVQNALTNCQAALERIQSSSVLVQQDLEQAALKYKPSKEKVEKLQAQLVEVQNERLTLESEVK